jgi:hypothetical protein
MNKSRMRCVDLAANMPVVLHKKGKPEGMRPLGKCKCTWGG